MQLGLGFPSLEPRKKKRPYINKKLVKKVHGNKCVICSKTEKQVGKLEMAHIRAHSRGGSYTVPMCPNDHTKFDSGLLTNKQLKKIGMTKKESRRYIPKKKKKKRVYNPFLGEPIKFRV